VVLRMGMAVRVANCRSTAAGRMESRSYSGFG
jgi:hypothetical protein